MKKLVLLEVNESTLEELGTNFETEMGWLEQSGMQMIDSASVPDCSDTIQDYVAQVNNPHVNEETCRLTGL